MFINYTIFLLIHILYEHYRPDPNSIVPVDLRPLPKEPENEKKKSSKSKSSKSSKKGLDATMDKLNISHPTNFEHTVHVGFDPITGEFTVSNLLCFCVLHQKS